MKINLLKELSEPIFYVTNDVGKGIGLEKILPNYHIICLDDHPLVDILQNEGVSVFCLERVLGRRNVLPRSSGILLSQKAVLSFIQEKSRKSRPNILFFKPQKRIELVAEKFGFRLLGNSSQINRLFEDKIEFFQLCQKEKLPLPDGEIVNLDKASFDSLSRKYGEILVIQFGRGWAGNSTFFVGSDQWQQLKKKYGNLRVKVSRFIAGKTVLNNAVIFQDQILVSEPALQIKANPLLTATQSGTGGREWPARLTLDQKKKIKEITRKVGLLMKKKGYRGFFGLDFLIDESGKIFLSENNARLTASVPFYTKLEIKAGAFPLLGFHLLSFLPFADQTKIDEECPVVSGGEIVARNNTGKKLKAMGTMATGIYKANLKFIRESAFLDSQDPEDFWLQTVAQGRIINPEVEIAKINTFSPVSDLEGNLLPQYSEIIIKIRRELCLKEC